MLDIIPINNSEILETLNKFLWFYDEREKEIAKCVIFDEGKDRDYFTGDKHRDSIMSRGSIHDGFPEAGKFYSFKTDNKNNGGSLTRKTIQYYTTINEELQVKLCTKNNALCAMYPPKGFISWHNNANASAYNLIFTWSETGEGYFKYIDGYTGNEIWICDPDNVLNVRAEANSNSDPYGTPGFPCTYQNYGHPPAAHQLGYEYDECVNTWMGNIYTDIPETFKADVAYNVLSTCTGLIKESQISPHSLADKLLENKFINDAERRQLAGLSADESLDRLLGYVKASVKEDGEDFGLFLDMLKQEDTRRAERLAKKLIDKYKSIC